MFKAACAQREENVRSTEEGFKDARRFSADGLVVGALLMQTMVYQIRETQELAMAETNLERTPGAGG